MEQLQWIMSYFYQSKNLSWTELYRFQDKYKKDHNLTASEFLRAINLSPCSTYVKYLSSLTDIEPSTKEGSIGKKLRDAVEKAKTNVETIIPVNRSYEQIFQDFLFDNESELLIKGMICVSIDNINNDVFDIDVLLYHYQPEIYIRETFRTLKGIKIGKITLSQMNTYYM